ncbi:MAG: hypothetical protein FWB79_05215 [Treponema sp.]|nr:hypothetical protein [Treponema sp.]
MLKLRGSVIVLVSAMTLVLTGCPTGADDNDGSMTVPGATVAAQLAWLRDNAASNNVYVIEVGANADIAPQDLSFDGTSNIAVNIRGTGAMRTIGLSANGSLFEVGSGVTLILGNNITLRGRSENNAPLVLVEEGGSLVMNTGSVIAYNARIDGSGGGVEIMGGGTFTMNGGRISDNSIRSLVWIAGGGVHVWPGGKFTMNGGEISHNASIGLTGGSGIVWASGGGVRVGGTFRMYGGAISRNTARNGGGVAVDPSGTFVMRGGEVSNNACPDDQLQPWSNGGGVFVSGAFIMHGGAISGNTAISGGGGVDVSDYSEPGGVFTMYGGTISGNTARNGTGGVAVGLRLVQGRRGTGTFNMRGGAIYGNTAYVGGGVNVVGIFNISNGAIYGNDAAAGRRNTAANGAALYVGRGTAATSGGNPLGTSETTVRVVNGNLQ